MKKVLAFAMVALLAMGLVFAGGDSESSGSEAKAGSGADNKVTLVYAEVNPLDTIVGRTATYFKQQVEELTNGSVTIDIKASGVLGSENDILDSMLAGGTSIDISRISAFALTSYGAEKSTLLSLPYFFESREHFWAFANSDLATEFLNEPKDIGLPVRGLFYGEEGFRHFFTVKPVKDISDLKGMKLRVSNDPIMNGLVNGLGASPTVVSFGELYSALQTGVVDGAEQPIANYKSNAFQEVAPYLILDGHTLGAIQAVICDNAWKKLTVDQQEALIEAGKRTQAYNQQISQEAEDEVLAQLAGLGVTVVEVPDKTAWANAVSNVNSQYEKKLPELYAAIQALK